MDDLAPSRLDTLGGFFIGSTGEPKVHCRSQGFCIEGMVHTSKTGQPCVLYFGQDRATDEIR